MIGLRGFLVLGLVSVALGQCAKAPPQPAVLPVAPVKAGPEISLTTTPVPLSALVGAIDHLRIGADDPPNLASAIRSWVLAAVWNGDNLIQD